MQYSHRHRAGFSLIELAVVMCVLVALMALGFVVWGMLRGKAAISSTHALVGSVAAQFATYSARQWTWEEPSGTRSGPIFDLNGDGFIDGAPGTSATADLDGGFSAGLIASGYRGFVAMTGAPIKAAFISKNRQPIDAWKRPLRISFAGKIYGTSGYGIWSAGPDGLDGTADDLTSWGSGPVP